MRGYRKVALRIAVCLSGSVLFEALAPVHRANAETEAVPDEEDKQNASPAPSDSPSSSQPASGSAELALKLSNPLAAVISVPRQTNYDFGMGPNDEGWQVKTTIQPVVPIDISENWTLISRTILPIVLQDGVAGEPGAGQSGLGDTQQALFFSPKKSGPGGVIWGVGPIFLLPTATNPLLGDNKWGIGPNAVVLKQSGPWTFGGLANHIWSVAGDDDRPSVSSTFLQPFVSYTTPKAMTYGANLESSYDWKTEQWIVPLNLTVSQLLPAKMTGLPMPIQIQVGYRAYLDSPATRPDGGLRLTITALFAN